MIFPSARVHTSIPFLFVARSSGLGITNLQFAQVSQAELRSHDISVEKLKWSFSVPLWKLVEGAPISRPLGAQSLQKDGGSKWMVSGSLNPMKGSQMLAGKLQNGELGDG
jgi:hypothetical protein